MIDLWGWKALKVPVAMVPPAMQLADLRLEVAGLESVQGVDIYINGNVLYRPEREDEWTSPAETLMRGHGDCEDPALLKCAVLNAMGKEPALVIVRDLIKRQDHALCICEGRVLDSFNTLTLPIDEVQDYRPVMGYARGAAWTYGRDIPSRWEIDSSAK